MEIAVFAGTVSAFNEKAAARRRMARDLRNAPPAVAGSGDWAAQMAHDFPDAVQRTDGLTH